MKMEVLMFTLSGSNIKNSENRFLSRVSNKILKEYLRVNVPLKPEDYLIRTPVERDQRVIEVWFRTRWCHHFLRGGCTMCNYGLDADVSPNQIADFVHRALDCTTLDNNSRLLVSPSGSFLDDWEVPEIARKEILTTLSKLPWASLIFETRAQYVTRERIAEIRDLLGNRDVIVDIALECSDPWILKYSINKNLSLDDFLGALEILKTNNLKTSTNILLGAPFLSEQERIWKAVESIYWAFNHGVDECCVFPVHIKKGTLVHWLWKKGVYQPPSLWSLVEVLKNIATEYYPNLSIAWHKPYYENTKSVEMIYSLAPTTCPLCYQTVTKLLDEYLDKREVAIISKLDNLECKCKDDWHRRLLTPQPQLIDRVVKCYKLIGITILGQEWWDLHRSGILDDLRKSFANKGD